MSYNKRWSTNIIHLASLHKESTSYSITPMFEKSSAKESSKLQRKIELQKNWETSYFPTVPHYGIA